MEKHIKFGITSSALHILAMAFMLCDHMWAKVIPGNEWLTCVGRLAFPIFAFMITEGYFYTGNTGRYIKRLFILAILSEIPFNLMYTSTIVYPFHQNVVWTLLTGLILVHLCETVAEKRGKKLLWCVTVVFSCLAGGIFGYLIMSDYYGAGILTVMVFYIFRGRKWWCLAGQILGLLYINAEMLGGRFYPVELFGYSFEIVRQSFALFSLVFIWLYNGEKGYNAKWFKYFCYAFYPLHMLAIALAVILR